MYEFLCANNHVDAARKVFTEGQRLGYRLDASAMSGRLRKRLDLPVTTATGYSKRCQRDLDRFYNRAIKDAKIHFSSSFQCDTNGNGGGGVGGNRNSSERRPPSFTVLKNIPLVLPTDLKSPNGPASSSIPLKTKRIVKKQKSLSYAKIRHSCNEVLHLSIDCHSASGEDNSNTDTARTHRHSTRKPRLLRRQSADKKRVKFKKHSPRTNTDSAGDNANEENSLPSDAFPHRANYLLQRNRAITEKRDKEYLNELFHSKSGEIERDVQGFVRLNYTLVGKYLSYDNSSYKHKLLQALRWRLNLNEKLTQRTLQDFIKYDLLRIKNTQYYEKTLMELLLWPPRSTPNANCMQNSMARLLNGIVSYEEGRNYIGSTSIVNHLLWGGENELYKVEPSRQFLDSGTAGMLVAAMMKLSCVPWQRKDMLNKNVVTWTLGHLEDIEYSGTVFQTKYSLALLNCLLRLPEAMDDLTQRTSQVLVLLSRYLRKERSEWFFTVKSILVKLFKHKSFRQAAKKMNFETLLRKLINPLDFKTKKEIEFIILYLNDSGNITQLPCSASHFEVEEKIVFDAEIEADDDIVDLPGLEGELLLEEQFAKYRIVYQLLDEEVEEETKNIFCDMKNEAKAEVGEPKDKGHRAPSVIPRMFSTTSRPQPERGNVQEGTGEDRIELQLNPLPQDIESSSQATREMAVSIEDELIALTITAQQHPHEVDEKRGNEAVSEEEQDDNNDVVIGILEEVAANQVNIVVVPPSESESSPVVSSAARTFPNSLSMSSLSSLEEVLVLEPKVWQQFPKGKGRRCKL